MIASRDRRGFHTPGPPWDISRPKQDINRFLSFFCDEADTEQAGTPMAVTEAGALITLERSP